MTGGSALLALGRFLPPRAVTNDELAPLLDRSSQALHDATGVGRRHYVEAGLGPSDLAVIAARDALTACGRTPADVDLIVFATMTPDIMFPGAGCFLQDKLGCGTIGALDLRMHCAGFLAALSVGDRFIRAGKAATVLAVGAEVHSTALDYSPAGAAVTPYFGDGAGVLVLGPGDGVRSVVLHNRPEQASHFWCEYPASRHFPARMELAHLEAGEHYYRIDLPALHALAEPGLADVVDESLARAGVAADAVAAYVLHYLDPAVARRAGARAGLPSDRVVVPAEQFGHVAAGGIPIALADLVASGRVRRGELVCCAAFGAGLASGATVVQV